MNNQRRESIATGLGGALLGGATGRLVGWPLLGAGIGAASGLISGARRMYDWKSGRGVAAFVLDHTWALATTSVGVIATGANKLMAADFDEELTVRQNRMVHRRGLVLRRGFAVTFGYVVNGAGDENGSINERRRKLVTHHEDVHVWQARKFGPLYPVVYVGWFVGGAIVAAFSWIKKGRSTQLSAEVDRLAYYCNPFEWHAYSRDDNWPPRAVDAARVWSKPFREFSRNRAKPR